MRNLLFREAMYRIWQARSVKRRMQSNPSRYDVPRAHKIVAAHVRAARSLNHRSIRQARL